MRALLILVLLLGAGLDAELLHAHDPMGAPSIDCPGCIAGSTAGALPVAFPLPSPLTLLGADRLTPSCIAPAIAPSRRVSARGPP